MAKHRVFINGVDLSEFVKDVTITADKAAYLNSEESLRGLGPSKPITISGLLGGEICAACGQVFLPSPDGPTPHLIATSQTGASQDFGPLCLLCGMAFVAPSET